MPTPAKSLPMPTWSTPATFAAWSMWSATSWIVALGFGPATFSRSFSSRAKSSMAWRPGAAS